MEDVKELCRKTKKISEIRTVSILVLMEDVKEHLSRHVRDYTGICFNPCFNGRCKRTVYYTINIVWNIFVSILVLMEDVKELYLIYSNCIFYICFNPCFNGRCKRTAPCTPLRAPAKLFQSLF